MTAQEYIQAKLNDLKQPLDIEKSQNEDLVETIYKLVMSKKFRKYSCNDELQKQIRTAIELSVSKRETINFTFLHGAYKLWRLEESPETDWAELFSAMYYTNWLKGICQIYEPGVWFDFFVDDQILPLLHTATIEESQAYRQSFQKVLDFLKPYQPSNFKMTINSVSEQVGTPEQFKAKLKSDVEKYAKTLPGGLPELSEERIAMIDLNVKTDDELTSDPEWRKKNALIHDAYISLTKRETNYHWKPNKIKVFSQPLPSGTVIAVGTTKDSVAKFWTGVGVLKPRDDEYRQIILSPNQLNGAEFNKKQVSIDGLDGKNFHEIRVLKAP